MPGQRGVAALEFALTVPALVLLLFGMYDFANGWMTWSRLTSGTFAIGQIATTLAVQPDGTNSLSPLDATRASTAILASMPQLTTNGIDYGVVLSEVVFKANPPATNKDGTLAPPTYTGTVSWTVNTKGKGDLRPCARITAVGDNGVPSLMTLPQDAFQANPILVVDTTYSFTPLFLQGFIGPFQMRWAAYFPSRSGTNNTAPDGLSDMFIRHKDDSGGTVYCP